MQVNTSVPATAGREASWWAGPIRPATIALLLRVGLGLVMLWTSGE